MNHRVVILALSTLILAACSSAPQRVAETRNTPAPVEDRVVGAAYVPPKTHVAPVTPAAAPAAPVVIIPGGYLPGDGPGEDIPDNLDIIPDAIPKSEPLHRYANRPYAALGTTYTPLTTTGNFKERGIASWYGKKFHGQRTSSGELYDMYSMTAAHPTLPIPSYAKITNVANQKSIVVRVNDRGPFLHDRVIDLSYTAAHKLGIVGNGSKEIEIESLAADVSTSILTRTDTLQSLPLESSAIKNTPLASTTLKGNNYYLQLGAFKTQEAADSFMSQMRSKLNDAQKQLGVFLKDGLTRVNLGPYANQNEALRTANSLKAILGFKPLMNIH